MSLATHAVAAAPAATSDREARAAANSALNVTHAMAGLRERGGRVVRAIEERRRALVATRVKRLKPEVVVDVGCEDGWMAEAYADAVARLVLSDLDPAVLARSPLAGRPGVEFVPADALDPTPLLERLGRGGADVLVLSALLEHLPEPAAALRALAPLVKPGGHVVVYVPADGPILFAKRVLKAARLGSLVQGLSLEPAPGHVQRFTRSSLVRLLAPFGDLLEVTFDPLALGYVAVLRPRGKR